MNVITRLRPPVVNEQGLLYTSASCVMDTDEKYRFVLSRRWKRPPDNQPRECDMALGVMLNPSTADALKDDATIRRWNGFAQSWGLAGFDILNLYALRSTNPKKIWAKDSPYFERDSPFEDQFLLEAARKPYAKVIFAWGSPGSIWDRGHRIGRMMWNANREIVPMCFGFTKNGSPKHPLRLAKTTQLVPYRERPL